MPPNSLPIASKAVTVTGLGHWCHFSPFWYWQAQPCSQDPSEEEQCRAHSLNPNFLSYHVLLKLKWPLLTEPSFVKFNIILNFSALFWIVILVGSLYRGIYFSVLAQRWTMHRFWWVNPIFLCYLPRKPRDFYFPWENTGNVRVQKVFKKFP